MHSLFSPRSYNEFPSGVSRCGRRLENATGSLRSPLSGVRTQICASGRRWRRGKMRAPWHVTGARGPKMSRPAWTYDTRSCHDTAAAATAIVAFNVAAVAAIGVAPINASFARLEVTSRSNGFEVETPREKAKIKKHFLVTVSTI